jgi:phosphoribosyl 1,2-cyclic phosphate phosphodiesterase
MGVYKRRFTVLGCASSPGVPRINGDWGACDPDNPKNRRSRAAFMVEQFAPDGGKTTVVIDTGPDFRQQMISAGVDHIDAVIYTHAHADHLHGIDDLRVYWAQQRRRIPVYADQATMDRIADGFGYCLKTPVGSNYPAIIEANLIDPAAGEFVITGEGGPIGFKPHQQHHGDIFSLGFRMGDVAYCTDVNRFTEQSLANLQGLDVLVIDALQYKPHPSHFSLSEALDWIAALSPKRAVLTHMHIPLDYDTVMRETPDHVEPAYDLMRFEVEIDVLQD